jgi:VWFA-related protein
MMAASILAAPTQIRSRVDAVRIDVSVINQNGSPQAGLVPADFEVFDNGRRQPLTVFSSDELSLSVVFVLDMSSSMAQHVSRSRAITNKLVQTLLPGDKAAIGSLTIPGTLREDPSALREDFARLPSVEVSRIWRSFQWAAKMAAGADARRAILMATDGLDVEKTLLSLGVISVVSYSATTAAREIEDSSAQLYVITPGGISVPRNLRKLAENSGGRVLALKRDDELLAVWEGIAAKLRQQYLIAYSPPERDGRVHRIQVRVKRPGLKVRARRSYRAPSGSF